MIKLVLDGLRSTQKVPLMPSERLEIYKLIRQDDITGQTYWAVIIFCFRTILAMMICW